MTEMAPGKFGMGAPVRRKEDTALITGHGRYTDDIQKIADLRLRIASGELDLAFRSTLLRARAPKQFK